MTELLLSIERKTLWARIRRMELLSIARTQVGTQVLEIIPRRTDDSRSKRPAQPILATSPTVWYERHRLSSAHRCPPQTKDVPPHVPKPEAFETGQATLNFLVGIPCYIVQAVHPTAKVEIVRATWYSFHAIPKIRRAKELVALMELAKVKADPLEVAFIGAGIEG